MRERKEFKFDLNCFLSFPSESRINKNKSFVLFYKQKIQSYYSYKFCCVCEHFEAVYMNVTPNVTFANVFDRLNIMNGRWKITGCMSLDSAVVEKKQRTIPHLEQHP